MPYPNPSNEQAMREISDMGYFRRKMVSEVERAAIRAATNKKITKQSREANQRRHAIEDRLLARELGLELADIVA